MRDLTISDLVDLVVADCPDAGDRIEKMFDWHFERSMSVCRWALGAAASIAIGVIAALSTGDLSFTPREAATVIVLALASFTYGVFRLRRLSMLQKQFVAALKLHAELSKISPFVRAYREELKE